MKEAKNYRIKAVTVFNGNTYYYAQKKILGLLWVNLKNHPVTVLGWANDHILEDIVDSQPPIVKYIEPQLDQQ